MINPKDLIQKLTVEQLCSTAEDYFKSIADPTPQMVKPFSSFVESPEILQNMGYLLSGMRLGKTMTVLEFGAGTCWFSRFLNQLQCETISCDVSLTALKLGERLFEKLPILGPSVAKPRFLHFNGRSIDLPDGSVDRIICFDAFHHIPNQEEVIAEMARVLKQGGIAGFSEPGRFHSQSPQSQYEMNNYTVLENDIIVSEIFDMAKKHGFTDIKFKLLTDLDISIDQYQSLIERRAGEFSNDVYANACNVMTNKTIFFLHKGDLVTDSRSHHGLGHRIVAPTGPFQVNAGEEIEIPIEVTNTGHAIWLNKNTSDYGVVKIGSHLYDSSGALLDLDFSRHLFQQPVHPGTTLVERVKLKFPHKGEFRVSIDLVSEAICWFENAGSQPQSILVQVR